MERTFKENVRFQTGQKNLEVQTYRTVSYTHLDVYKRQLLDAIKLFVGLCYFKVVLLCVIVVYVFLFCVFSLLSALNIVSCFVLICICSGISLFCVLCLLFVNFPKCSLWCLCVVYVLLVIHWLCLGIRVLCLLHVWLNWIYICLVFCMHLGVQNNVFSAVFLFVLFILFIWAMHSIITVCTVAV